VEKPP